MSEGVQDFLLLYAATKTRAASENPSRFSCHEHVVSKSPRRKTPPPHSEPEQCENLPRLEFEGFGRAGNRASLIRGTSPNSNRRRTIEDCFALVDFACGQKPWVALSFDLGPMLGKDPAKGLTTKRANPLMTQENE